MFLRKHGITIDATELTSTLSDYEILKECGGMEDISFLFLAKHVPSGHLVSLKLTDLTLSQDSEFLEEVTKTIKNSKLLKHSNVLTHFLSFVEEDEFWSVTLPLEGTLRAILKESFTDGFNEITVATILKEALRGMLYIHENHFIHNDIRADNILIDSHGDIRLGGFRQMSILQQAGQVKKTAFSLVGDNIEWSAPEVMTQNSNFNASADVYSLGITALELAFNKTPYDNMPPLKVLLCKQNYEYPPAIKTEKSFSRSFYKFIQACTRRDPASRPSVEDLLDHPFLKYAKNCAYLQTVIVQKRESDNKTSPTVSNAELVNSKSQIPEKSSVDNRAQTPDFS